MPAKLLSTVLVALVLLAAPAAATSADPYQPLPRPECFIKVHKVKPGERVKIVVGARLNAADQPSGTITVRLSTGAGTSTDPARAVWTKTVHSDGRPVTIVGPVVPRGTHVVTSTFVPDDPTECAQCQGRQSFAAATGGGGDGGDDNGGGPGGLLPDTGGPALLWVLVGVGLVGGGVATVIHARRRGSAPLTA